MITYRKFCMIAAGIAGLLGQHAAGSTATPLLAQGTHHADAAGVSLQYVVAGTGPLLFVVSPGWGVSSLYLQRALVPLEQSSTIVFIDSRGSGGSSRPLDSRQMSTAVMANDVERLRKQLGVDSIQLLGHSNGGSIALDYSERYPSHVSKLVLLDPEIEDDEAEDVTRALLDSWNGDPRYHAAVEAYRRLDMASLADDKSFTTFISSILPLYFSNPDLYLPEFSREMAGTKLSSFAFKAQDSANHANASKQSQGYGAVTAKTFIVSGTVDWVCPYQVAQRVHAGIRGSVLSTYANVGHMAWIEQPTRFFSEITRFLAE